MMKNLNRLMRNFILLFVGVLLTFGNVYGQNSNSTSSSTSSSSSGFVLKGALNDNISCIDESYCSNDDSVKLVITSEDDLYQEGSTYVFSVYLGNSFTSEYLRDDYLETYDDTTYFYPTKVSSDEYTSRLYILAERYTDGIADGHSVYDYTSIKKAPDVYTLYTSDEPSSCKGSSFDFYLDGSESTIQYSLYRLNSSSELDYDTGDGGELSFSSSSFVTDGYYVIANNTNNECSSAMEDTISLVVNDVPDPTITPDDETVCLNDTVTYRTESGMSNYSWTSPSSGATVIPNGYTDADTITIIWTAASTYTLTVNYDNESGCTASSPTEEKVTVNSLPGIESLTDNTPVCSGNPLVLTATAKDGSGSGYSYSWTYESATVSGETGATYTIDPATSSNNGTYGVSVEDSNGCASTAEVTDEVSINEFTVALSSDLTTICSGTEVTFTASSSTGSTTKTFSFYLNANTTASQSGNDSIYSSSTLEDGDEVYVVVSDGSCEETSDPIAITVNPLPDPTITADEETVCLNDTVTYRTESGMSDYVWTIPTSGATVYPSTYTDADTISIIWTAATDYTISVNYVNENGCTAASSTSASVTVNDLPEVESLTDNTPVCSGSELLLTATPKTGSGSGTYSSYIWTYESTKVSGASGSTYSIAPATSSNNGTYGVRVVDSNGCTSKAEVTDEVSINEFTVALSSDLTTICSGTEVTFTASSTSASTTKTFSFYLNTNTTASQSRNDSIYSTTTLEDGDEVYVVISDGSCEVTSDPITITVNPLPDPTITADEETVCLNDTVTYRTESGMSDYVWTIPTSGATVYPSTYTDTDTISIIWTAASDYTISVNYVNGNGCTAASATSASVTVNDLPEVESFTDNTPVCSGSELLLTATPKTGSGSGTYSSYIWTYESSTISGASGSTYSITPATSSNDGTYGVRVVDSNGCTSEAEVTDEVSINEFTVALSSDLTTICSGTEVTFTASSTSASTTKTFSFYLNTNTTASQSGNDSIYSTTTLEDGDEVYVVVSDGSCEVTSDPIAVTVNSLPSIDEITYDSPVCSNNDLTLIATASGGSASYVKYDWTYGGSDLSESTDNTYTISSAQTTNNGTYGVTVTDDNGCSSEEYTTDITVNESPEVTVSIKDDITSLCSGDDLSLDATVTSGTVNSDGYSWFQDGTSLSTTSSSYSKESVTTSDAGYYKVIAEDTNGCTAEDSINVTVNQVIASIVSSETTVCSETDVEFTASATEGSDNYEYQFFVDDVEQGSASSTATFNYEVTSSCTVSVIVNDLTNGCSDTASIDITALDLPTVSLISPTDAQEFCENDNITLEASPAGYSTYTFYSWDGTTATELSTGSTNSLAVSALDYVDLGSTSFYVVSDNGSCTTTSDYVSVVVNERPTPTLTVSPSTNIIYGNDAVFTAGGGTSYAFYVDNTNVTDGVVDNVFTTSTLEVGTHTVLAQVTDDNTCDSVASVDVTVYDAIDPLQIKATATEYCADVDGVTIYFANTDSLQEGVTYELIQIDTDAGTETQFGSSITYTGSNNVRWDNVTGTYEYRVDAYYAIDGISDEVTSMSNTLTITELALPSTDFTMSPTGDVEGCNGGTGYTITLSGSESGVTYYLLLDGAQVDAVDGNGSQISFESQSTYGVYTIMAKNSLDCDVNFDDTLTISAEDDLTKYKLYVINDDDLTDTSDTIGDYCVGGTGVKLGLAGSDSGLTYKLYLNGTYTDKYAEGTGDTISFGTVTDEGTYMVKVESSTGCLYTMANTVEVSAVNLPDNESINSDNSGNYCEGDDGVDIWLSDSEDGVTYYLYYEEDSLVDTQVATATTGALYFDGPFTDAGTYTVVAENSTGCTTDLVGSALVSIQALPELQTVTSNGNYCQGDSTYLTLASTEKDIQYILYKDDNPIDTISGTGGERKFYISEEGTYYVEAIGSESLACGIDMEGGPFTITENALPDSTLTINVSDAGTGCDDGSVITIYSSESDVTYNLYKIVNGEYVVTSYEEVGNGGELDFDPIVDTDATYTALATNANGCSVYLSDTAYVNIDNVVTKQTVTGNGEICEGDGGVTIGLDSTETSVNYYLYYEGDSTTPIDTIVGTGDSAEFDTTVSAEGEYYVMGDNTSCQLEMTNRVTLTVNALPTVDLTYTPTSFVQGTTVTFNVTSDAGSDGEYAFYVNGTLVQDSTLLYYETSSLVDGDTVVVDVSNANSCFNSDTVIVTVLDGITELNVASSSDGYCSGGDGVSVYLTGTPQVGITYALINVTDNEQYGDTIYCETTSDSIKWDNVTGSSDGTDYTVIGFYSDLPDQITYMNDTVTVYEYYATASITGSSTIIEGDTVTYTASGGVYYVFYVNDVEVTDDQDGVDSTYTTSNLVDGDVVSVLVTDEHGCTAIDSISVTVKNSIEFTAIASNDGEYCSGDNGVSVYLDTTPQVGVTYKLVNSGGSIVGSTIAYTGSETVMWDNVTVTSGSGSEEFTIQAYYAALPTEITSSTVTITVNDLPSASYTMTPTDDVTGCNGGEGYEITLNGSEEGIDYTLLLNDIEIKTVEGHGSSISFDYQSSIGVYTIIATNTITGCDVTIDDSFEIKADEDLDTYNIYVVNQSDSTDYTNTDGGYCADDEDGVEIGLDGSTADVTYTLYKYDSSTGETTDTGVSVVGDGDAISFGYVKAEGIYSVRVESSTGCEYPMTGSVDVQIIALPVQYSITVEDGGYYCEGGEGVIIGLENQEAGVTYKLYRDGITGAIDTYNASMSGASFEFGTYTTQGTYSVTAVSSDYSCTVEMLNTVDVSIVTLPTVYDVTTDGDYCEGGGSTYIYLSASEEDVDYTLLLDGVSVSTISGASDGGQISFEVSESGTYTIEATRTIGSYVSCPSDMKGSVEINVKPLPDDVSINTTYSGTSCEDGAVVSIPSSQDGVTYTLVKVIDGSYYDIGIDAITGDGSDVSFSSVADADASYTALATLDGCSIYLTDTAYVNIDGAVAKQEVTGDGTICEGEEGVAFGLADSQDGVTYYLYLDGYNIPIDTVLSSGGVITFEKVINEGDYYVVGTYVDTTTGDETCGNEMANRVTLTVNPLPTAYSLIGSGQYCDSSEGAKVQLEGSEEGVTYYLQKDGSSYPITNSITMEGTGDTLTFYNVVDNDTIYFTDEGTYTVYAETEYGCTSKMNGSIDVESHDSAPDSVIVVHDDLDYCSNDGGVSFSIDSTQANVTYTLVQVIDGEEEVVKEVVSEADGEQIDFGTYTDGTYMVIASWGGDACEIYLVDSDGEDTFTLSVASAPTEHVILIDNKAIDDTTVCVNTAVTISLDDYDPNVTYRLMNASTGRIAGADTTIASNTDIDGVSWPISASSTDVESSYTDFYEVIANPGSACETSMGIVAITFIPQANAFTYYAIAGEDSTAYASTDSSAVSYCPESEGVTIGVETTEEDVSYMLVNATDEDDVYGLITGDGTAKAFSGTFTTGKYMIKAGYLSGASCYIYSDTITVSDYEVPSANFNVYVDNSTVCSTDSALIYLSGSEEDIEYRIEKDGVAILDTIINTSRDSVYWYVNSDLESGEYEVFAISGSGCDDVSIGSVDITFTAAADATFSIVTSPETLSYCENDGGLEIGLTNIEAGVYYWLVDVNNTSDNTSGIIYKTSVDEDSTYYFDGTYPEGDYTVIAKGGSGCDVYYNDTIEVQSIAVPSDEFSVLATDSTVCINDGTTIYLDGSEEGFDYVLYSEDSSPEGSMSGTGDTISWDVTDVVGTTMYTVYARTGSDCDSVFMGSVEITYVSSPSDYTIFTYPEKGEDSDTIKYCEDDDGVQIGVLNSEDDVYYWLVDISDTSDPLDVQLGSSDTDSLYFDDYYKEGDYTVIAKPVENSGCSNTLDETIHVREYPLPDVSDSRFVYCVDGDVDVSTDASYVENESCVEDNQLCIDVTEDDVNYYLYDQDSGLVLDTIEGDGYIHCFDAIEEEGNYLIYAKYKTDAGCDVWFDDTYYYDHKDYGTLAAVADTIYLGVDDTSDTLNLRANDILKYFNEDGDATTINYPDQTFTDTTDVIDRYIGDISSDVSYSDSTSISNIRFRLLSQYYSGTEDSVRFAVNSDSTVLENDFTGNYTLDKYTGILTYVKKVNFYGYDKIQYEIYNEDIEGRDSIATVYIFAGNEDLTDDKTFIIPNAFSPNGDGVNDTYIITIDDDSYESKASTLQVFNRWGTLVYRSTGDNYGDNDNWWDGTSNQASMVSIGQDLPNGTYFYVYKVEINAVDSGNTISKEYSGYIELRR